LSQRQRFTPRPLCRPTAMLPRRRALAALLFATAAPLTAQSTPASPLAAPIVLALARGGAQFRTLRVRVGHEMADYLFDTGGGVDVVAPADSAAAGCLPGGRAFGVRLTGEALTGRACANATLGVGPLTVTGDAGLMDLARMLGPRGPAVRGQLSLAAFAGRAITLDLAHDRLVVETPASLAARVRGMTPVPVRLATGEDGGHLTAFVGLRAPSGAMLWLEWDSGNGASTLLAPHALAMLGGDTTRRAADVPLPLAPGLAPLAPVLVKRDMIYDGVLSAAFLARATWTLDLAHGRLWVGAVAPVLALPADAAAIAPPVVDPVGTYLTTATVGGHDQHAIVRITRERGTLVGHLRPVGEEAEIVLDDVRMTGATLSWRVPLQNAFAVELSFDGLHATGRWGDGGTQRGGPMAADKRG